MNRSAPAAQIRHIFIAPQPGAEMSALTEVQALENGGLQGDRYQGSGNPEQALTLIEGEHIEGFVKETGLCLAPHAPRRNIVTQGIELNRLCGQRFLLGEVEIEGIELCEPCASLVQRTYPEVLKFFVHKGGLRARVIRGGVIRVGDRIQPLGNAQ